MVRRGMQEGGREGHVQLPSRVRASRGGEARRSGPPEKHQDHLTLFLCPIPRREELHAALPRRPWPRPTRNGYEKGCVVSEDKWEG